MEDSKTKDEYQVRVHVIEGMELKGRDKSGMSDPVAFVKVMGKEENTDIYHQTTACTFDRLFLFRVKMNKEQFNREKIRINIFDANTVLRNVIIGSHEIDIAFVYAQPNHEVFKKWLVLTDPKSKFEGVQGYLKVSILVLAAGDEVPHHEPGEGDETLDNITDLQSMVIGAPSIESKDMMVSLKVLQAQHLPKMDSFGKCDAYVNVNFAGNKVKTSTKKKTLSPVWNQELLLPYTAPCFADRVSLNIRDWDSVGKDELIALLDLSRSEIEKAEGQHVPPRWYNLYADMSGKRGMETKKLVRGRILLESAVREGSMGLKPGVKATTGGPVPPERAYTLRVDLAEADSIPDGSSLQIQVLIANNPAWDQKTKWCAVKKGHVQFYVPIPEIDMTIPTDPEQMPDLFLLCYSKGGVIGKDRFGYIRFKLSELKRDAPLKWHEIELDPYTKLKSSEIPGYLLCKVTFGPSEEIKPVHRVAIDPPKLRQYQLRANIYQGRDLAIADNSGANDPYVRVVVGHIKGKTRVIPDSNDPMWFETVLLDVELAEDLTRAQNVSLMVYDKDDLTDDFIGRCTIHCADITPEQKEPRWYDIFKKNNNTPEGRILASFQLVPKESISSYPLQPIKPKSIKPCFLDIAVMSLKDLTSVNGLPMNKPQLKMYGSNKKNSVETKPKNLKFGKNDLNILETVRLSLDCPDDARLAPVINIRLVDETISLGFTKLTQSVATGAYFTGGLCPWDDRKENELRFAGDELEEVADHELDNEDSIEELDLPHHKHDNDNASDMESDTETREPLVGLEDSLEGPRKKRSGLPGQMDIADPNEKEDLIGDSMLPTEADELTIKLEDCKQLEVGQSFLEGAEDEEEEVEEKDDSDQRPIHHRELDKVLLETSLAPFQNIPLYKHSTNFNPFTFKMETKVKLAGTLKAVMTLQEQSSAKPMQQATELFKQQQIITRIYVLRGHQLAPQDDDGFVDAYIEINNGKKGGKPDIVDKKNMISGTLNPGFYKCYEFPTQIPSENSTISLSVWDHDPLTDDLVGTTEIDLENRWYSQEWQRMAKKPIEFRNLWHPASKIQQGRVEMWIDMMTPEEARKNPPEDIRPPQPEEWSLRVIVWNTKDVVFKDSKGIISGPMSDIFVSCKPERQKRQTTDVHYRSEDGKGMFNWRMVWNVSIGPEQDAHDMRYPYFNIQIWDNDSLPPNEAVCEARLNLKPLYRKAYKNKKNPKEVQQIKKQWIEMTHPNFDGCQGRCEISVQLMPASEAAKFPVGLGRGEPNQHPNLPKPNRPDTSFNPFLRPDKYLKNVLWRKYRWKVLAVCGCLACIVILAGIIFVWKFVA